MATNAIVGYVWDILLIIVGVLAVIAGIVITYIVIQYKHKIRIREVINDRKVIIDDKARTYKDKDGVTWWKLLKTKTKIPVPPDKAVDINSKGKKIVEFWRSNDETLVPIIDDTKAFTPEKTFTTNQRTMLIAELKKAHDRKKRPWTELLLPIAGIAGIIILVVSLMVFWGDLAKPILEMGDKQAGITEQQMEITILLQEIIQEKQVLKPETIG